MREISTSEAAIKGSPCFGYPCTDQIFLHFPHKPSIFGHACSCSVHRFVKVLVLSCFPASFFWLVTDRCTLQSKSRRMCIPPNSGDIFPKDKIDKGNTSFMGLSPSMDMFLFTCFFMGGQGVTFDGS